MMKATSMREFHNDIKLFLLSKYSSYIDCPNIRLLDIGVGRGGDIHKWMKCNIRSVVGVDVNKMYVHDAIGRVRKQHNKFVNCDYRFYYMHENMIFKRFLQERNIACTNAFHIVSCMFAFHYFCSAQTKLDCILKQISDALVEGGYFIGVVPQGDTIHELLSNKSGTVYETESLHVERCYSTPQYIGDRIKFMLSGTLYFGEKMLSEEYLVFQDTLVKSARKFNLELVEYTNFEKYYVQKYDLNATTRQASFLNGTFAFRKTKCH